MFFSNSKGSVLKGAGLGISGFILLGLVWIAVLWFGFQPQWESWGAAGTVAMHVLPPIAVGLCIVTARTLHLARIKKQLLKEAELKAKLQQEQEKEQQQKIAKELAHRRFALPVVGVGLCSAVAETAIAHVGKLNPMLPARKMKPCIGCEKEADSIVLYLRERLVQVLDELDLAGSQKLPFPLWFAVPDWLTKNEAKALLDSVWYEVYADTRTLPASENVRFLRNADLHDWVNQAFALFDAPTAPPGLLLLGVDSPFYAVRNGLKIPQRPELAAASEAAVAVLIAHPNALTSSNADGSSDTSDPYDALTPYWEKKYPFDPAQTMFFTELAERSAIAYLHRPVEISTYSKPVMEEALHAGLVNASISQNNVDETAENAPILTLGAFIQHGEAEFVRHRQSMLNQALTLQGVDYQPDKAGMFITDLLGFIGNAGYWAQCAVAALLVADREQPVLWTKQGSGDTMLLGLFNPAIDAVSEGA